MWTPIVLTPPLTAAGVAGVLLRAGREDGAAGRLGALLRSTASIGVVTHFHGVRKRPGGFAEPTYNLVMGPPLLAPGSLCLVGALGLARRDRQARALMSRLPRAGTCRSARRRRRRPARSAAPASAASTPQMHGRYPDFDVLEQADHWDEVTRKVVLDRVENVPPIALLRPRRGGDAEGVLRRRARAGRRAADPGALLRRREAARGQARRLPLLRHARRRRDVAARRAAGSTRRRRRAAPRLRGRAARAAGRDRPPLREGRAPRRRVGPTQRRARVRASSCATSLQAFYSHPWAWNEIGFGGPAYPRGYAALRQPAPRASSEAWEAPRGVRLDPVSDTKQRGLDD